MSVEIVSTVDSGSLNVKPRTYDYVIVGAGSAGCTLANRLTEDEDVRVLVLEAGGWDRDMWIHLPLGWGRLLQQRRHDWMYESEPVASLAGRRIECARGKVVGGSSSINAMAYVRGNRADYDRWAAAGLTKWSYAHALPYFRRQERWEGGATPIAGATVRSRRKRRATRIRFAMPTWMPPARAGLPVTGDYNGAQQDGFARMQMTIEHGRRCSGSVAYLRPALSRPNLTVETKALATRLLFEGTRAVGVEYIRDGEKTAARADREVILAGGSINSPQLLMLSGIGDPGELSAQRLPVTVALPGVGKNLQDHVAALVTYARREGGPFQRNMRLDRLALGIAQGFVLGTGFATNLPGGLTAFLKSDSSQPIPDIQLLFIAAPLFEARPYLPPFSQPFSDGFACRLVVLRRNPRANPAGVGRPAGGAAHRAEPARDRPGSGQHPRRHSAVSRARTTTGTAAVHQDGDRTRSGGDVGRGHRHAHPRDGGHRPSPGRHLPHGDGRDGGRRSRAARTRHGGSSCRRCVGFSRSGRRQHQCRRRHDRREGRGPDPRPGSLGGGSGVNLAAGDCEHGLRNECPGSDVRIPLRTRSYERRRH